MPSIFRKRKNRRHTAANADETKAAVRAARKSISKENIAVQTNDEVFVDHTKDRQQDKGRHTQLNLGSDDSTSNASSQANGHVFNSSSMPRSRSEMSSMSDKGGTAKSVLRSSAMSLHADILFLRWKGEVKRAPVPSPLTMATLKSLFVAMFGVEVSVKKDPHWVVFMQDTGTEEWLPMVSPHSIPSRSLITIKHCDNLPTPPPGTLNTSKLSSSNPSFPGEMSHALTRRPSSRQGRASSSLQRIQSGVPAENGHTSSEDMSGTAGSIEYVFKDVVNRVSSPEQRLIELEASILQENLDTTWAMQWSTNPDDKSVRGRAATLQLGVHQLQKDLRKLRVEQQNHLQLFQHNLQQSCDLILAKLRIHRELEGAAHLVPSQSGFRRKRLELEPEEAVYLKHSGQLYEEFTMLDAWVDELRVDVAQRGCKVVPSEIHVLSDSVATLARGLLELQKRHGPLVEKLKTVMEKELEVIVREERFVGEEETRVASTIHRCEKMEETLLNLRKVASVQHHRSPSIPFVMPDIEPDRHALLDSIQSVIPDHARRVQRIKMSEEARIKKKELLQPRGPKLADQILQNQSKMLKKTDYVSELESRQLDRVKSMYVEEKREKEQAKKKKKEDERRAEEEKRAREQFLLDQRRKEEEEQRKFNEECRKFNELRRERERKREELRKREEEWQLKEAQRANIKQLSEQERLQEWRRREHFRIQVEQRGKQHPQPGGQRSGSQSSPENMAPMPPPMGGPPPYSGPTNPAANPESMFNMLMMPSAPAPTHGAKRTVTLDVGRPKVPPAHSHTRKVVHTRSQSTDSKAKEQERKEKAAALTRGHTATVTALHLENQSRRDPHPPAAGAQRSGVYSWLPQEKKTRSHVGSYYSEQQLEPAKRDAIRRRLSNPNKRDRSDPHRHSVGADVILQPTENGAAGGTTSNPVRLAQSTDMSRLPMATGAPPPPKPVSHVNSVPKQLQPSVMINKAPPIRTAAQSNGIPIDSSVYSSFV